VSPRGGDAHKRPSPTPPPGKDGTAGAAALKSRGIATIYNFINRSGPVIIDLAAEFARLELVTSFGAWAGFHLSGPRSAAQIRSVPHRFIYFP
jgi:hypothetical protein